MAIAMTYANFTGLFSSFYSEYFDFLSLNIHCEGRMNENLGESNLYQFDIF